MLNKDINYDSKFRDFSVNIIVFIKNIIGDLT